MRRRTVEMPDGLRLECGHDVPASASTGSAAECRSCDLRIIPDHATVGRRTPTFTPETTPAALRNAHHTAAWAELIVERGEVHFFHESPPWKAVSTPSQSVVIVPGKPHHVAPQRDAQFHVQFFDH